MRRVILALTLAAAALAACGNVRVDPDAPPPPTDAATDGESIDAAVDAGIDGMPIDAPAGSPGQELTGGGGRVSGATFTMDVQIGHPIGQQKVQSTTYRLEANTPIKP